MAASVFWFGTFLFFALWQPLVSTIESIGASLIDVIAVTASLTGLSFLSIGLHGAIVAGRSLRSILLGLGIGLLGLYLERAAALLFGSTRLTRSGGIAAIVFEAELRVYVCGVVIAFLAAGVAVPWARLLWKNKLTRSAMANSRRGPRS